MTSHEIVVRFGRAFDVRTGNGAFLSDVREVTAPFADRESAEAAMREVTVTVRPVHDAGAEDYRPVVAGEVMTGELSPPPESDDPFGEAIRYQTAAMRASLIADLSISNRELARDLRELEGIRVTAPLGTRCPGCGIPDDTPMDSAPLPVTDDEARSYRTTCGRRMD